MQTVHEFETYFYNYWLMSYTAIHHSQSFEFIKHYKTQSIHARLNASNMTLLHIFMFKKVHD